MKGGGKTPNAIYVTEGAVLDDKHAKVHEALGINTKSKGKKSKGSNSEDDGAGKVDSKSDDLTAWMCEHYYDVRMMGALMVGDLTCGKVRGPLQLSQARSVETIVPVQMSITRMAATKASEKENKTMGNKWIVPYGLYRVHGYINAPLAAKSGATDADLDLLWEVVAWRCGTATKVQLVLKCPHGFLLP